MSQELSQEVRAGELLTGCLYLKMGWDGLPDRLIIYAPSRHCWIEWKTDQGDWTPAQRVRIPQMIRQGEKVFFCTKATEAPALIEKLRAALLPSGTPIPFYPPRIA